MSNDPGKDPLEYAIAGVWSRHSETRGEVDLADAVMSRSELESRREDSNSPVLHGVMRRDAIAAKTEPSDAMAAAVMLRVRGAAVAKPSLMKRSASRVGSGVRRRLVLVTGGISAIAAMVFVAFGSWSGVEPGDGAEVVPGLMVASETRAAVESDPTGYMVSAKLPTGQVRYGAEVGGRKMWLLSTGAVQGVRVGDVLDWAPSSRGEWDRAGHFQVLGVSPFHAFARFEPGAEEEHAARSTDLSIQTPQQPTQGDWVSMDRLNPAANRILSLKQSNNEPLLGLGMVLAIRGGEVYVADVIAAYWWPGDDAAKLTLAGAAGVMAGDKIVGLLGKPVTSLADVKALIESTPMPESGLSIEVERGGARIALVGR